MGIGSLILLILNTLAVLKTHYKSNNMIMEVGNPVKVTLIYKSEMLKVKLSVLKVLDFHFTLNKTRIS